MAPHSVREAEPASMASSRPNTKFVLPCVRCTRLTYALPSNMCRLCTCPWTRMEPLQELELPHRKKELDTSPKCLPKF